MEKDLKKIANIFDILSNEVRLCILFNLIKEENKSVGGLQICAKASQSVVSQQLSKLKAMGIIKDNRIGNKVYYSIIDEDVKNIIENILKVN